MTKKRKRPKKKTIAVLPILGVAATFYPAVPHIQIGDWEGALRQIVESGTGYSIADQQWYPGRLLRNLGPLAISILAHKAMNALGVNRIFTNLPAPLNKLRL